MKKNEEFKLGQSKLTSRIGIGAVIIMLITYTFTCYAIINNNKTKSDPLVINTGEEKLPKDIPVPCAEYQVNWECGTYYSYITEAGMESYLQTLDKEGWKSLNGEPASLSIREGTNTYRLIREDTVLQLITYLPGEEMPINNSILIRVDRGISLKQLNSCDGAADGFRILSQIQAAVDQKVEEGTIPENRQKITGLLEIYIPEAYERLAIQAFAAVSDWGFSGCFLVRKGVVSYVEGDLVNAVIADIDQDGRDEMIDLYTTWQDGLFRHHLVAYEYQNPHTFNSLTEIPMKKYSNCFIPEGEYEKLYLVKQDEEIKLHGELSNYGAVTVKEQALTLEDMEHFPYTEWSVSYDQSLLLGMDKKVPKNPPDINITIDGIGLDYVIRKTSWKGITSVFTLAEAWKEIVAKNEYLPKVYLGSEGTEGMERSMVIDFGDSIPDSIKVSDSMLDENGQQLYGEKHTQYHTVRILDSSRVSFELKQHMSLSLSSDMRGFDRDWRRMFLITCRWGEKECVYALLINTGKNGELTEIVDHDFLQCEGSYSSLSSNWGLGLSVKSEELPERYIIEWQLEEGILRSWNSETKMPNDITGEHNSYPATYSWDANRGAVIWKPLSFEASGEVKVRAVIYEEKKSNPIAYSNLILIKENGGWQKKR